MSSATDFSSKRRGAAPRLSRLFDLLAPILSYCLHANSTTLTGANHPYGIPLKLSFGALSR
jgi:hypothetical protein